MTVRPVADRLAHIDSLRALAALLVALAHLSQRLIPLTDQGAVAEAKSWPRYFDFGITGVVIFFAISGFVIYGTLRGPRAGVTRRFAITRFCRLYPAYWVSMVVGLIFIWWWRGWTITPGLVAANVTMLPTLLGQRNVMGLYWTLETELVFYVACWLVWRLGWIENPPLLAGLVIGFTLLWFGVKGATRVGAVAEDLSAGWKNLPRHLGIMFWGAYFRIVYDETRGFREACRKNRKLFVLIALSVLIGVAGGARQFRFFVRPTEMWFSPYVTGPVIVWLWVAWWRVRFSPMAWLGKISYSIYLFHLAVVTPLVWWLALEQNAAWRGWPMAVYMFPTLLLTVLVAAAVYYAVELPAVKLGERLAGSRRAGEFGTQAAP